MKNIAIINATALSVYATQKLADNSTALSRVIQFCGTLPGVAETVIFASDDQPLYQGIRQVVKELWDTTTLLQEMRETAFNCAHIFYVFADCPFLSIAVAKRMYENHIKYYAQYAFADGYPYGLAPEILMVDVIPALLRLSGEHSVPLGRNSLFELIQKDINAFDIETEISPQDLRLLRVSLSADTKRNTLLINRLLEHGAESEETVIQSLQQSPEMMRTLPAFINVQIVEGCPQNCTYCPYPAIREPAIGKQGEMPVDKFLEILDQVEQFCDDAILSISLWGEPAYHSQITELILSVARRDRFGLIVETSGVGWKGDVFRRIKSDVSSPKNIPLNPGKSVTWILSLDAWSENVYRQLRGEGIAEALETAENLLEAFPQDLYVQAVRMKDNEEDLERFFKQWKERTGNVIVQKYDHFCEELEDKRVTDLSPLKRFPCWHIKRDVVIRLDGSVPMCREDIRSQNLLGNIWEHGLEEIWNRGSGVYNKHLEEKYPPLCRDCDEYYTYNF